MQPRHAVTIFALVVCAFLFLCLLAPTLTFPHPRLPDSPSISAPRAAQSPTILRAFRRWVKAVAFSSFSPVPAFRLPSSLFTHRPNPRLRQAISPHACADRADPLSPSFPSIPPSPPSPV
ncbi:unnamed protein product [Closterium sp. NIES-53]